MEQDAPRHFVAPRQKSGELPDWDAFHRSAIPPVEGNAAPRRQQQRVEKLLAKLPMASPRLAVAITPQRGDVDEDGPHPGLELHVVSGRVRERRVLIQQRQVQIQMEERCGLERRKWPLIRI